MSDFYGDYIKNVTKGDERTKTSIDAIFGRMEKILDERAATSQRLSGLVVGRVQSGKTRNYIGLTLKAADAGWNVVIVLTSAIKALAAQTRDRLKADFKKSNVDDSCCKELVFIDPYDNDEPTVLAKPGKEYFYWGVAMKNSSSLNAVRKWFDASADCAPNMRVLVIDDEADNATPDSNSNKSIPLSEDQIADEIDAIRACEDGDYSHLADWLEALAETEMPDEAAKTPEAKTYGKLMNTLKGAATAKSIMSAVLGNPDFRKILGMDEATPDSVWMEDLGDLAHKFFSATKERSPSMFVKVLRSVLGVAQGRSAINNAIVSLVDRVGGSPEYTYAFAKCAYVGYTATPYACILNERPDQTPLYADFIASLDKSPRYFGLDAIYGSDIKTSVPNMKIVRSILPDEQRHVLYPLEGIKVKEPDKKKPVLHHVDVKSDLSYVFDGKTKGVWQTLRTAVAWTFCAAAARRWYRINVGDPAILASGRPKKEIDKKLAETELRWTTMLFNISQKQTVHTKTRDILNAYLAYLFKDDASRKAFAQDCQKLWKKETDAFTKADFDKLFNAFDDESARYGEIRDYCAWEDIEEHLLHFFKPSNRHVIVINCGNKDDQELYNQVTEHKLLEDHLWFICGGNTISRGLTLTGLVTSYFDRVRKSVAVDTMTQMGRWFGYRPDYELLPRVWMTSESVIEMKRTAVVEDRMHLGIKENFANGFSPCDQTHYQQIYSFGRRLSGRVRAQRNESVGVGTYGTTDAISVKADDVKKLYARTSEFVEGLADFALSKEDEAQRQKTCPYAKTPFWKGVGKEDVVAYLKDIRMFYPEKSRLVLEGLIQEISRTDSVPWNVVIGEPETGKGKSYALGGSRTYKSGTPKALVVGDVAHYSAVRLHMAYYAAIPGAALNKVDIGQLRDNLVNKVLPSIKHEQELNGGNLPVGIAADLAPYAADTLEKRFGLMLEAIDKEPYSAPLPNHIHGWFGKCGLEGFRNRSSSDYMEEVHDVADDLSPMLQIYLLTPPEGIDCGGLPLVSVSFYWPKHEPDIFHAVSVGLEPKVPMVSRRKFYETVMEVLSEYDFPMPVGMLRQTVLNSLGLGCTENFFNAHIGPKGIPEGYPYVRVPKRDAYMLKQWAAHPEKRFDQELLAGAIHILQDNGKAWKIADLYAQVLAENPKLAEFFLLASSNDKARFAKLFTAKALAENKLSKMSAHPLTLKYSPF